jgi:hypothetical protein
MEQGEIPLLHELDAGVSRIERKQAEISAFA